MIDKLDKEILNEMNKNARLSFRDIAKILGVSVATISHRVKKMEDLGIIKGYIPLLDQKKVGYDFTAVIEISIEKGRLSNVEKKLAEFDNTLGVYDITGLYDALVIARFKDRDHLNDFIKKIQKFEFVQKTYTSIVLEVVKEDIRIKFNQRS
ncbi:MAG: Lrp/AsnC family transcriptional regulator [Methanomicrobia archaeon]|nr:Lrp/AsnC family transcriptional regulator [Methanomicrobia archaeon]RLF94897.1 MAG: AsnC family transcriptional regulator [Thermococci archaeon]RLF95863.1 MAG: AsnC family transcriptional regulator [Thermococci archaeon]RLF99248.1 MAG: AsnC family transcriptional regulator [Thermococci archaeon]